MPETEVVAELGRCGAAAGVLPLFRLVDYCRRWQRRPPIEVRVWMDFSSATIEVLGGWWCVGAVKASPQPRVASGRWSGPEGAESTEEDKGAGIHRVHVVHSGGRWAVVGAVARRGRRRSHAPRMRDRGTH
jgi:hypothetical protein